MWNLLSRMVHGLLQATRQLWVTFPFSRRSSQPRDQTQVSCIAGGFFTRWATREAQESLVSKTWYFWTVILEKTLESPLDCKEVKPVNPKGNQPWIFVGKTDAEAEMPILWPPDRKNWLIWKDPDAGKDWRWEEKGMTEDEIFGWHHRLNGHDFEQAPSWWWTGRPGVGTPWGRKESDMTEHWTDWYRWHHP